MAETSSACRLGPRHAAPSSAKTHFLIALARHCGRDEDVATQCILAPEVPVFWLLARTHRHVHSHEGTHLVDTASEVAYGSSSSSSTGGFLAAALRFVASTSIANSASPNTCSKRSSCVLVVAGSLSVSLALLMNGLIVDGVASGVRCRLGGCQEAVMCYALQCILLYAVQRSYPFFCGCLHCRLQYCSLWEVLHVSPDCPNRNGTSIGSLEHWLVSGSNPATPFTAVRSFSQLGHLNTFSMVSMVWHFSFISINILPIFPISLCYVLVTMFQVSIFLVHPACKFRKRAVVYNDIFDFIVSHPNQNFFSYLYTDLLSVTVCHLRQVFPSVTSLECFNFQLPWCRSVLTWQSKTRRVWHALYGRCFALSGS